MNKLKTSIFLAYKGIVKGNIGTTILTVAVMTLAFINLLFLSSILLGLVNTMNRQGIDNIYANIVIEPEDGNTLIPNAKKVLDTVKGVPGVIGAARHYNLGGYFTYDKFKNGQDVRNGQYQVISVDPEVEKNLTNISKSIISGSYLEENDRELILIGKDVAGGLEGSFEKESLGGVVVGDEVNIVFENGVNRTYKVKGIFNSKFVQSDKSVFITRTEMESILGLSSGAHEIIVKTDESRTEDYFINKFSSMGLKEEIYPWTAYMGMTSSFTKSFSLIRTLLSAIALLVAGITIYIVVYINVLNRKRHIGILRAIGIEDGIILRSYVLQAVFYASSGILIGLMILQTLLVPYFQNNPLEFPVGDVHLEIIKSEVFLSSLGLLFAGFISGYIPSRKIINKTILESIWG